MLALNFSPFPGLITNRLNLRQLSLNDENEIFKIRSAAENADFLDRPICKSLDEARAFINKINDGIKKNECIYWAVTQKGSNKLIGTICFWNINKENATAEIGFELLPEFRGQGLMKETVKEVIEYGFEKMKLSKIDGEVHHKNLRSINLMVKLNFTWLISKEESGSEHVKKELTIIYELVNENVS